LNQAMLDPNYRNTIQEARTFVKMANILCYGLQGGKMCLGGKVSLAIFTDSSEII